MIFQCPVCKVPAVKLLPFIDLLRVVLIFLMLSTTCSEFTEIQLKLPVAHAQWDYPKEVLITVMGATRRSGLSPITLATPSSTRARTR
jgi:biopolymer transport protein ExbD